MSTLTINARFESISSTAFNCKRLEVLSGQTVTLTVENLPPDTQWYSNNFAAAQILPDGNTASINCIIPGSVTIVWLSPSFSLVGTFNIDVMPAEASKLNIQFGNPEPKN